MQQVNLKSALNSKDFEILYQKEQIQFQVINFDICDWWIEIYLCSDWSNEADQSQMNKGIDSMQRY